MPVESFVLECRDFANRLLAEMDSRIRAIGSGAVPAKTVLNAESLREQQEAWRTEFESYFKLYEPDVAWPEAESALQIIAEKKGLHF
jgi:hypothetical protein